MDYSVCSCLLLHLSRQLKEPSTLISDLFRHVTRFYIELCIGYVSRCYTWPSNSRRHICMWFPTSFFFKHQLLFPFLFNRFVVESLLCLFSLAPFRHTGPILSLGNTVLSQGERQTKTTILWGPMQNGERAPAAVAASCPPWSYHASDQIRVCSLDHSLCGHLTTRKRNPATLAQQRKAGCKGAQEREEKIPRVGVAQKHKVFSMYEVHGLFRTVSERQQNNNARRWQETRELQQR